MAYKYTVKTHGLFKSHYSRYWQTFSEEAYLAVCAPEPVKLTFNMEAISRDVEMAIAFSPKSIPHYTIVTPSDPRYPIGPFAKISKSIKGLKVANMLKKLTNKIKLTRVSKLTKKFKKTNSSDKVDSLESRIGEIEINQIYESFTPYTLTPVFESTTGAYDQTSEGYVSSPYHTLSQASPLAIDRLLFPSSMPTLIPCTKEWESPFSDTEWGEFVCAD